MLLWREEEEREEEEGERGQQGKRRRRKKYLPRREKYTCGDIDQCTNVIATPTQVSTTSKFGISKNGVLYAIGMLFNAPTQGRMFFRPLCVQGGGVYLIDAMHGRSRMAMRPWRPYNAGTEHVGFFTDQADSVCTEREAP